MNCAPAGALVLKPHMPGGSEQIRERGEGLLKSRGVARSANARTPPPERLWDKWRVCWGPADSRLNFGFASC